MSTKRIKMILAQKLSSSIFTVYFYNFKIKSNFTSYEKQKLCFNYTSLLQAIVQYHQWSTMSAREVNQLQKDLAELENGLTLSDSTQQLRTELTNLRNKVLNMYYPCLVTIFFLFFFY